MPEAVAATNGASDAMSLAEQFHAIEAKVLEGEAEGKAAGVILAEVTGKEASAAAPAAEAAPKIADAVEPKTEPDKEEPKPQKTTPADWAALREEKRQLARRQTQFEQGFAAREQALRQREQAAESTSPAKVREYLESGNFDAIAQAMGVKDWNALNEQAARAFADPGFRREQEMKRELEAIKAERLAEKAQQDAQRAEFQRQQEEQRFVAFVDSELKVASDPAVKALAQEPEFIQAVYGHIAAHYRQTGEQLDPHEAAEAMMPGIRARYAAWHQIFGTQPTAQQAETVQAVTPNRAGSAKPARPTKHVSKAGAADASRSVGEMSHADFVAHGKKLLEQAISEDLKNGEM